VQHPASRTERIGGQGGKTVLQNMERSLGGRVGSRRDQMRS